MTLETSRSQLIALQAELLDAREVGMPEDSFYMRKLTEAIEDARIDYTVSAVGEIASLRHDLATAAVG